MFSFVKKCITKSKCQQQKKNWVFGFSFWFQFIQWIEQIAWYDPVWAAPITTDTSDDLVTLNFDKSLGKLCPQDGTQVNSRPGQIIVTKDLTKPEQLWYYWFT